MAIAGTTVELEFNNVVVNTPFVVGIQTSGVRSEVYVKYGSLKLVAVQDVDYSLEFAIGLLSFTITPLAPLLAKIAINGPNVLFAGRNLSLTSDFDNDDAFVREKLVTQFDRVWMGIQEAEFQLADLEDLVATNAAAAISAAAALASQNAAAASATAAAASAASLTYATTAEMLAGTAVNRMANPDNVAALWERGTDVVAAANTVMDEGGYIWITGNTGINGITFAAPKAGRKIRVVFTGTPLLTHSATFLLPGGINKQVVSGDQLEIVHDGGAVYRVTHYQSSFASTTEVLAGVEANKGVTPDALAALWEWGGVVASAASIVLGDGGYFTITGVANISDIDFATDKVGRRAWLNFNGAATLVHSATLIVPGGNSLLMAPNDIAEITSDGSDIIRVQHISQYNGKAIIPHTATEVPSTATGTVVATNVQAAIAELAAEKVRQVIHQAFTGVGTYTPTAGMLYCIAEAVGGGGGGGGAITSTGGTVNGAGGGGGGSYARSVLSAADIGASKAIAIGAAGAAGAAGNNAGGAGGNTTLGTTLVVANGGGGGGGAAAAGAGTPGAGGAVGTGTMTVAGQAGRVGYTASVLAVGTEAGGQGGNSRFGDGGHGAYGTSGNAASGFGGGGGGASDWHAGGNRAGGAGTAGYIIITEFVA